MTILFDATVFANFAPHFGIGIFPTATPTAAPCPVALEGVRAGMPRGETSARGVYRPSAEESAWWAAECDRLERDQADAVMEWLASESAAYDAMCLGFLPADLAARPVMPSDLTTAAAPGLDVELPEAFPFPYGITPGETPMPCWTFDRADRLRDLIDRARSQETYLTRARCDAATLATVRTLDRRLVAVRRRLRRLYDAARSARRSATMARAS